MTEEGGPAETPKRLAPRLETLRELFLKSGNLCAFHGCDAVLMDEDGTFAGQICHIEGAKPNAVHLGGSSRHQNFFGCCDFNRLQPAVEVK